MENNITERKTKSKKQEDNFYNLLNRVTNLEKVIGKQLINVRIRKNKNL